MAVRKPRSHILYFRVTEEEHKQLLALCDSTGARSLSHLIRTAIQRLLSQDPEIMGDLNRRLQELNELLRSFRAAQPGEHSRPEAESGQNAGTPPAR